MRSLPAGPMRGIFHYIWMVGSLSLCSLACAPALENWNGTDSGNGSTEETSEELSEEVAATEVSISEDGVVAGAKVEFGEDGVFRSSAYFK